MEDLESVVAHIERALTPIGAPSARSDAGMGLISGDLRQQAQRVLFATEVTRPVVGEAIAAGADLLLSLLAPPHMSLVGERGRNLRRLVRENIALYSAGESAPYLVAEAVSGILDLQEVGALQPRNTTEHAVLVVYTPESDAEALRRALADAGAGAIGDYTGCAWSVTGVGEFTPQGGADPTIGQVGVHEQVRERRLEMVVPRERVGRVTAALREAHPYEEPAFSFLATHPAPGRGGRGRIGTLPEPLTAGELSSILTHELPDAHARIAAGGEALERIAICSNADEAAIAAAGEAGADVLISADITSELLHLAHARGLGLIDLPRGALTWAALPVLARRVAQVTGGEIETIVSTSRHPSWRSG